MFEKYESEHSRAMCIRVEPEMLDQIDRVRDDWRKRNTHTTRSDVVREALASFLAGLL